MSTIKHNMLLREIPWGSNVLQLLPLDHQWVLAGELCLLLLLSYLIYMRTLHPLAKYPGPLLASLTNGWKAYYVYKLFFHEKLIELHQRYGPIVRVGPNHLHFWDGNAIAPIYKGGRSMGKSEFYDAFTAFNPNLFGTTNDDIHSLRRRQLSHGFSQASVQNLEPLIEKEMKFLQNKLRTFAKTGETFDLKSLLSLYVFDILGSVAFGRPFGAQERGYEEVLPAINDHLLLAGIVGELPLQSLTKAISGWSPIPWMRRLMKNRNALKKVCAECVKYKISNPAGRQDLLKSLVKAVDPDTGSTLTEQEINSEAFAVLVAGSHSTSGTLTLLFWHLLQNPDALAAVQTEIESTLPPLAKDQIAYPIQGLESSLNYLMACVRENFRINPVFTMPLWRRVGRPDGLQIGEYHIPHNTNVCISNYVLHHNPSIWGTDHDQFKPTRWLSSEESKEKARYLIPFSIGHRMCIGRNLAMTNILKTVTSLLAEFDFEPVTKRQAVRVSSPGIGKMVGSFRCRVSVRRKD